MMAWKICFSTFISMDSHSDWHTLIILHSLGRGGGVCQLDKKFRGAAFPVYLFNLFLSSKYPTFCYSWLLTLLFCYGLVPYSHWNLLSEKRKKAAVNLFQISSAWLAFLIIFWDRTPSQSTFHVWKSQSISLWGQPHENFCSTLVLSGHFSVTPFTGLHFKTSDDGDPTGPSSLVPQALQAWFL